LITHAWSAKAKKQMLDAMQKIKNPREIKDPLAEYEEAKYHFPGGGCGFPSIGIKAAMVNYAHKDFGIEKTLVRKAVYIKGTYSELHGVELVKIQGEPEMREDPVTVGISGTDLRYRPVFHPWKMNLEIVYDKGLLTLQSVVNLLQRAGFSVGIGEWRPEKNGQYGQFRVAEG
jgi:hypothetical protein